MIILLRISEQHVVNIMQSNSRKFQSDRITQKLFNSMFSTVLSSVACTYICIIVEDSGWYKTLLLAILSKNLIVP